MKYGIFSSNTWLYTDSKPEDGGSEISLYCPGNSFGCIQLLCECTESLTIKWVGDSALSPEINKLIAVKVEKNCADDYNTVVSPGTPAPYATRQAPFSVYDPMEPVENGHILPDENRTCAVYLRWNTKDIPCGKHEGNLLITSPEEILMIPVTINVASVEIPDRGKLRVTNWYNLNDMAKFHGAELWSEEHWDMIRKYAKAMRECRQTDFMTHASLAVKSVNSKGEYIYDFFRTKRFIEIFLEEGFTHIEGETIVCRANWGASEFLVRWGNEKFPAFSEEGIKHIESYYSQWYEFLKENNWLHIATQHVADEPHDGCAEDYCKLAEMFRKLLPGIPLMDAVETTKIDGAIDICVPKSIGYINDREGYDKFRDKTDIWFYTCCFPGGTYLNRLLDQELIRTRYLHWANYLYNFTGYLHWGFSYYHCNGTDPFTLAGDLIDGHMGQILPAGDTHLVYPKGKKVLRSVRSEAMRAGIEDYELLMLLSEKCPEKAHELVVKCVRSFTDYTTDIHEFEKVFTDLITTLCK